VRLCDVAGTHDLTVDPAVLAAMATPRTKALIVVHYAGFPCAMREITRWAGRRGLAIIEDCAHALFTCYRGKMLGL